jgi:hypothetical protein
VTFSDGNSNQIDTLPSMSFSISITSKILFNSIMILVFANTLSYFSGNRRYLLFNSEVKQNCLLKGIEIYAEAATTVTFTVN